MLTAAQITALLPETSRAVIAAIDESGVTDAEDLTSPSGYPSCDEEHAPTHADMNLLEHFKVVSCVDGTVSLTELGHLVAATCYRKRCGI